MTDPARMSDAELIAELERFGHGSLANDERGAVVLKAARRLRPSQSHADAGVRWLEQPAEIAARNLWAELSDCCLETRALDVKRALPLIRAALSSATRAAEEREREACAKVADGFTCGGCGMDGKASAAIRARSDR